MLPFGRACAGHAVPTMDLIWRFRRSGKRVRCPDALITCTKFPDTEQLAPDVVIIFEVISGDSGRRDRIEKVREYAAIPSIRRYVIVESVSKGLLVLHRRHGSAAFTALALTEDDTWTCR